MEAVLGKKAKGSIEKECINTGERVTKLKVTFRESATRILCSYSRMRALQDGGVDE